jgi:hypothetical protein
VLRRDLCLGLLLVRRARLVRDKLDLGKQVLLQELVGREMLSGCLSGRAVPADMGQVIHRMKALVGGLADAERSLVEVMVVHRSELLDLAGEKEDHSLTGVEGEELRSLVVEDNLLVVADSSAVVDIDFGVGIGFEADIEDGLRRVGSSSLDLTC